MLSLPENKTIFSPYSIPSGNKDLHNFPPRQKIQRWPSKTQLWQTDAIKNVAFAIFLSAKKKSFLALTVNLINECVRGESVVCHKNNTHTPHDSGLRCPDQPSGVFPQERFLFSWIGRVHKLRWLHFSYFYGLSLIEWKWRPENCSSIESVHENKKNHWKRTQHFTFIQRHLFIPLAFHCYSPQAYHFRSDLVGNFEKAIKYLKEKEKKSVE